MRIIEDILQSQSVQYRNNIAIQFGNDNISYSDLWVKVNKAANVLSQLGNIHRVPQIVNMANGIDSLIEYFAVHIAGGVCVPIDHTIPVKKIKEYDNLSLGVPFPEDAADILFTSGTTSERKGVIISHTALISNMENLLYAHPYCEEMSFIICGSLSHLGCLSKIFPTLYTGGKLIILQDIKNIGELLMTIDKEQSSLATFLVPTNIRLILALGRKLILKNADKIRFIETGAAACTQHDIRELCSLLPNTKLFNTYASTETGIISTHNFNSEKCIPGCTGKALPHSSFEISKRGNISCKGQTLMIGYLNNNKSGKEALKVFETSDNGYIDEEGMLMITGRNDDVINIGGYKIHPTEVENYVMLFHGIHDCICISIPNTLLGNSLKLLYVSSDGSDINVKDLVVFLTTELEPYKIPTAFEKVSNIKRTENGKPNRKFYKERL